MDDEQDIALQEPFSTQFKQLRLILSAFRDRINPVDDFLDVAFAFPDASIESRIIYLQWKQFRLLPESHHQGGSATHPAQSPAGMAAQLPEALRAEVG